ncbi:MAG: heavy-metal-associated domain-containing protein [Candidatus Izemoplasmataceae bacterium]|uniref:heavy-metal-associated domain-containing protein n=1 Tax=Liberiplasma polymorphum TaxID=3374570 RepID=UPI003774EB24
MPEDKQYEIIIRIEGMHCGSCLNRIDAVIQRLNPVHLDIDIASKMAKIQVNDTASKDLIIEAIKNIGYEPHYIGTLEL